MFIRYFFMNPHKTIWNKQNYNTKKPGFSRVLNYL